MEKKILVIYYSQSGQLKDIVTNLTAPLQGENISLEYVRVEMEKPFAFPWTSERFFDAMPESVLGKSKPMQPIKLKESSYDLVIVGYQPWYLSPSIPTTSILENETVKKVLKDTPVVTVIGARNMWINAQEKVKSLLKTTGARLVGNITLVDKSTNLISGLTILYWMFTGKKNKFLGILPEPGVASEDIKNCSIFGETILEALETENWKELQSKIVEKGGVSVKSNLMFIEGRAGRLFSIWANLISKKKNRTLWLSVFKYYLIFALFIVSPIVLLINMILFRPFFLGQIKRKKEYLLGTN